MLKLPLEWINEYVSTRDVVRLERINRELYLCVLSNGVDVLNLSECKFNSIQHKGIPSLVHLYLDCTDMHCENRTVSDAVSKVAIFEYHEHKGNSCVVYQLDSEGYIKHHFNLDVNGWSKLFECSKTKPSPIEILLSFIKEPIRDIELVEEGYVTLYTGYHDWIIKVDLTNPNKDFLIVHKLAGLIGEKLEMVVINSSEDNPVTTRVFPSGNSIDDVFDQLTRELMT